MVLDHQMISRNTPESVYVQLSKDLEKYILAKRLAPGEKLPSVKIIAENAGVSLKTAERALDILIKNGICFRRPKKGTFIADNHPMRAAGHSLCKSNLLVFLVIGASEKDPYHFRVLSGAEEMSTIKGFNLIYLSLPYNNDRIMLKKLKTLTARKDMKAILLGGKLEDRTIDKIEKSFDVNIPIVIMGRTANGFYNGLSHVTDSNGMAIRTALQFLVDSGHRQIAFLNGSLYWSWNREMREEFYQFVKGKDLPLIKGVIRDNLPDDEEINGYEAILEIIPAIKKHSVSALLCATDKLAQGAMRGLKEKGISIPQDISVVGLGNLEFGKYLIPSLTTVDQCEEEKGREGVNVATGNYLKGSVTRVPVRLIVRDSTRNFNATDIAKPLQGQDSMRGSI